MAELYNHLLDFDGPRMRVPEARFARFQTARFSKPPYWMEPYRDFISAACEWKRTSVAYQIFPGNYTCKPNVLLFAGDHSDRARESVKSMYKLFDKEYLIARTEQVALRCKVATIPATTDPEGKCASSLQVVLTPIFVELLVNDSVGMTVVGYIPSHKCCITIQQRRCLAVRFSSDVAFFAVCNVSVSSK
ncbi:hypothetical protein V5799_022755 [Amblyomma americanum]|uniref:Uncharacterized protein n=1 Tax=Amblyomma americanum TaxID=6943 RepID=A0AAQ4FL44_AMBAM